MLYSNLLKNAVMYLILFFGVMITSPLTTQLVPIVEYRPIDMKQLICVATNIFYEASGESILGQAAVAHVVMNRVRHGFAKTPCAVIYQSAIVNRQDETGETVQKKVCQFSWVCEGKYEPSKFNSKYIQAKQIAYNVMAFNAYKEAVPKTALFFHNLTVDPGWTYKQVARIDNHVFYSKGN